jgi:hypothetical protein
MIKHYMLAFCALIFTASGLNAQCTVDITMPDTLICAGSTLTLNTVAEPFTVPYNLNSTLTGGNNHRGNMFDVVAANTVVIDSFSVHPMGNTTVEVYYRPQPYAGFETSSAGWIFLGSAAVIAQPYGSPTPLPLPVDITIPAGQTYSFYVTSNSTAVSLNYTDGNAEGTAYASDANISFLQGVGMEYPFTAGTGGVFRPRVWNGIIHYSVPQPTTYSYVWNTGATTSSITATVNEPSQYSVTLQMTGCPEVHDTVNVAVSAPPVNAGTDAAVCQGDSLALTATGAESYSWNNGVTNGGMFAPEMTADYIVTGTDTLGCTMTDTVAVIVNTLPQVNGGNDVAICEGGQVTLIATGAQTYTWSGGADNGQPFTPAESGDYIVTGIGANNCQNTDTVTITVNPLPDVYAGEDFPVCEGSSAALTASGAVNYEWSSGVPNGADFVPMLTGDNVYVVTGTSGDGCQNSDTVVIFVIDVDNSVTVNDFTITASAAADSYQWYDCQGSQIAGETGQSFTPSVSGLYSVMVTQNGCMGFSDCVSITGLGLDENTGAGIALYPNPANAAVTIVTPQTAGTISVTDINGKAVMTLTPKDAETEIDIRQLTEGIYIVRVLLDGAVQTRKFVVKH